MIVAHIKSFYTRHERHISSLALLVGFIFDGLTIRYTSLSSQTLIFLIYIILTGMSILVLHIIESRERGSAGYTRTHFWFYLLLQFSLGSLFSMFFVFYSRGVSLATSWPFLLLLFGNLIGNEVFKKHYVRLSVQISLFFISVFSLTIYLLPLLLHRMGWFIFIMSGLLGLLFIYGFVRLLARISRQRLDDSRKSIVLGIGIVYVLINIFYFTGAIPPVPLTMKAYGVYHSLEFVGGGSYRVMGEKSSWFDFIRGYSTYHRTPGEPVYVATAVYAPADLNTSVVHHWQYYDESVEEWKTASKITVPITGGREDGYRLYSVKWSVFAGSWRVDVETPGGMVIGRVRFNIENSATVPEMVTRVY